ncbi:MAG: DUF5716 family protein [Lachnospiraceae bacterium]
MIEGIRCYAGMDISDTSVMLSFMRADSEKPETVSAVAGRNVYQIPLVIGHKKNSSYWLYGDEAKKQMQLNEPCFADHLIQKTMSEEKIVWDKESYEAFELLALFFRKVLALPEKNGTPFRVDRLVLTMEEVNKELVRKLGWALKKAGISSANWHIQNYKESFYVYTLNQKRELWLHDVLMFREKENQIFAWCLERSQKTSPQLVTVTEEKLGALGEQKDSAFAEMANQQLSGRIVSAVYLTGDLFEGGWMRQSLQILCKNRKAFMGKNLFSIGACYFAAIRDSNQQWPFVYMGENEMKVNVSMKVRGAQGDGMFTLISAGENWYETKGECDIILDKSSAIDFYLQLPQSRNAQIQTLQLTELPERPPRTTRLHVKAEPLSDREVKVSLTDQGFGEFFAATGQTWEYVIRL